MRQLYIFHHSEFLVPARHTRIGSCQDRGAGVEGADDTSLGDGEGLLFHDLVENGPCTVRHLVELINTADPIVTQNQSSSVKVKVHEVRVPIINRVC